MPGPEGVSSEPHDDARRHAPYGAGRRIEPPVAVSRGGRSGGTEDLRDWSFGEVLGSMAIFFFWVTFIWMFIAVFGDIFRRDDVSGFGKAGWILLICVLPFLGILIYMIARPKMTEQDKRMIDEAREQQRRLSGYSAADEIVKLAQLRDEGKITAAEYEQLKSQAVL